MIQLKDPRYFTLQITGQTRQFQLYSYNKDEAESWEKVIFATIQRNIYKSKGIKSAVNLSQPWKFENIIESQFLEKADTGDMLLYESKNIGSQVIRSITNGLFDHVAMILKFEGDPD